MRKKAGGEIEPGTGSPGISDGAPGTGERPREEGGRQRKEEEKSAAALSSPSFLPSFPRAQG